MKNNNFLLKKLDEKQTDIVGVISLFCFLLNVMLVSPLFVYYFGIGKYYKHILFFYYLFIITNAIFTCFFMAIKRIDIIYNTVISQIFSFLSISIFTPFAVWVFIFR